MPNALISSWPHCRHAYNAYKDVGTQILSGTKNLVLICTSIEFVTVAKNLVLICTSLEFDAVAKNLVLIGRNT